MCGRYTLTITDVADYFKAEQRSFEFTPSYNVAPTQQVPIVLEHEGERLLNPAKWGLLPGWILLAKSATPSTERSVTCALGLWVHHRTNQLASES